MDETIGAIMPVDEGLRTAVQERLDDLTKPRGSLGRLEELAMRVALIQGTTDPRVKGKRVVTFAGDHGVAAQGVSAYPQAVTPQMVHNMLSGGAAINVLTRHVNADLVVVDIGVLADFDDHPGLRRAKVRPGTRDFTQEPAMTREEATAAVEVGIELAERAAREGISMLGTGEMGIANTTPAAALLAALLPAPVERCVGRGTGVDDTGLARKVDVVKLGLDKHGGAVGDPFAVLSALGGLEIAGLVGLLLGAARYRLVGVVDGFISTAAALAAMRLCPAAGDYFIFSHRSDEAGHGVFFEVTGERPVLHLDMRLGEGTGAALAMSLIEASLKLYHEMATFSSAGVSDKS
ncbi:MAG: nicotinate-nucleotide--dimethylbenzimidazole phosphoribosyltransferase [Deltaproteobacteria bacterium]|nr:nicotinate-nucleotide--dimethylbenzimidazole phosphoribosyltransferase [Deltaproteobacteria bacterium]